MSKMLTNAVALAKDYVQRKLKEGAVTVDATVGNGHDTAFMAQLVGGSGKVYAFDIQAEALQNCEKMLEQRKLKNRVQMILDGHEKMDQYLFEPVDVVMFNLGYLPGGDRRIITTERTTLSALNKALTLLKPGGLVTLVVYYGHPGGDREKEALEQFVASLDQKAFSVVKLSFPNRANKPPFLFLIEKQEE